MNYVPMILASRRATIAVSLMILLCALVVLSLVADSAQAARSFR